MPFDPATLRPTLRALTNKLAPRASRGALRGARRGALLGAWRGALRGLAAAGLAVMSATAHADATPADCERLAQTTLAGASVRSAEAVAEGAFKLADGNALPALKAFCRIVGSATPTSDSDIRFEVWLPMSNWNGRLWGIGNGNFAGSISQRALGNRLVAGYAAVATDTGHRTADSEETGWAIGHPQRVVDFGHRGIHEAAVNAKRLVAAFYGRPSAHAYFGACSNGGRQALMEAQRYPNDYDGIIAGAPAHDWTHVYAALGQSQFRWFGDTARHIPESKLPAIRAAVLSSCDALDGVRDGVVDNPQQCRFDPKVLACKRADSAQCLTAPQVQTLRRLYADAVLPSGKRLAPGYARGTEVGLDDAHFRSGPGSESVFADVFGFWRDLVFENPAWDLRSFDVARDSAFADAKLASTLNANDADLSAFASRGGKLIVFHGWSDPLVPPAGSVDYLERVGHAMGEARAREFARLFMVPGMNHCGGGDGPSVFGQIAPGNGDPETSLSAALQRWVEQGIAPDRVVATQRRNDRDPASQVLRTRPLCAYPQVARYRGSGSTDSASSFECRSPASPINAAALP